jgi:5-formyltetrahydrofolate cyclo-ligase
MTLEIGSEWVSLAFAHFWLQAGGVLVLPRVAEVRTLELRAVTDLAHDLGRGVWGIREPKPDAGLHVENTTLDMIVAPCLACDDAGYRLGYGGGYFDALIESAPQAVAIGAGFSLQRVPRVPREPWDRPLRAYVSEAGVEHF